MTVRTEVLERHSAAQHVEWMIRRCRAHEAHLHQGVAEEAARHGTPDGEIDFARDQRLLATAEHGLVELDTRVRPFIAKSLQAVEQQPGRVDHVHGEPDLRLLSPSEFRRGTFEPRCFRDQRFPAPVQHLTDRRQDGSAPLDLEDP
jgi:hypothetical protein